MLRHRKIRFGWIGVLLLCLLCGVFCSGVPSQAAAGIVARPENGFVVDDAGVLSQETIEELNTLGEETDYSTGTMMVLITVDYTGTYAIDEYVDQVFDDWGIEDGLVLVMAIGDEDYYAIASVALSEHLRASDIQEILDEELEPDFAAGDYDAGARKVYAAFCERIEELYEQYGISPEEEAGWESGTLSGDGASGEPVRTSSSIGRGIRSLIMMIVWIVLIILIVVILAAVFGGRRGGPRSGYYGPGYVPPPRRRFFGIRPPRPRPPRPPRPRAPRPPAGRGPGRPAGGRGLGAPGGGAGRRSGAGRSTPRRGGGFGGGGSRGGGAGRRSSGGGRGR